MTTAFPLTWPEGWKRTPTLMRVSDRKFSGGVYGLTLVRARDQLLKELKRLGAGSVVISTNVPLRQDGKPYASEPARLADPGAAVYFVIKGKPMVMAQDRFESVAGNLRSLGLAIDAMRQLERHGGGTMMERAFTGFVALTPPDWKKPWRQVFGVPPDWRGNIRELFRTKAKLRHSDTGGSDQLMAELNIAYQEGKAELGQ
jgi:hypothetical protein